MVGVMRLYSVLLQIPGVDAVEMTFEEQVRTNWDGMGFMRAPLSLCLIIGIIVIIWKFFDLLTKSMQTKKVLAEVDELLAQHRIDEAL